MNPHQVKQVLDFLCTVHDIPVEQANELVQNVRLRHYERGEFFMRAGDLQDQVGLVLSGLFRIFYTTEDGAALTRRFCDAQMIVGQFTPSRSPQAAHVGIEALEPSTVAQLDLNVFRSFYGKHWVWERFGRQLAESYYRWLEWREYQFLAFTAAERYEIFLQEHPALEARLSQANVASYLGVTPESLSRIIRSYRQTPRRRTKA